MISYSVHDGCPPSESAIVDTGLEESNLAAAPLDEVQAISCFARDEAGTVVGGAIGRVWRECCELQQLWVTPPQRREGIGSRLLQKFEQHAAGHGCRLVILETFNFQAPELYQSHGYQVEYERKGYPHGIVKYHLAKRIGENGA